VSASKFIGELREITAPNIELHINSPGGDVYEGIAIYNALRDHPSNIVAVVDGIAASAASFIAVAADKVVMNRNAEVMIHDPWGFAIGNAEDMRSMAESLDKVGRNIANIYATRCGGTVDEWRQSMLEETWYCQRKLWKLALPTRSSRTTCAMPRRRRTASTSRSSITPVAPMRPHHGSLHCIPPKTNCALIAAS
jgi:hypothetical protein